MFSWLFTATQCPTGLATRRQRRGVTERPGRVPVTYVPVGNGFRLGCNRDERRDRAPALPPAVHGLSHRTAIFPVDPAGPGTWVGVNDTSLAAALLNRSADSTAPLDKNRRRSRGLLIPYLLECASLAGAVHRGAAVDAGDFDRFSPRDGSTRHGCDADV